MKFGNFYMTRGIWNQIHSDVNFKKEIDSALARYICLDWGEMDPEDIKLNKTAVIEGERVMGVYNTRHGRIWIITEWDRSATTVLFPSEY